MDRRSLVTRKTILAISLLAIGFWLLAGLTGPVLAIDADQAFKLSQETGNEFLGLRPDCDPTKTPSEPGACNISAFTVWIQRIIKWLFYISMPLALIFGMYGGFVIITAGGSEERVKHGRDVLKAAVIGLLIIFLSNLLVTTIINVLTKGKL